MLARFAREAQIAAALSHPNLIPVLDVGLTDGGLYLVMPLVDGGSLEDSRARFGDRAWARPTLAQLCAGVVALHERDIVHRDLKPANVLIDRGVARIADFGLASVRVRGEDPSRQVDNPALAATAVAGAGAELTRVGEVFGTTTYMAPELAGGVGHAKPSDIFALGLIAHELLVGRAAFAKPPLLAALAGQPIEPPVLGDVEPIVVRCLALDPAARPSAVEMAATFAVP